MIFTIGILSVIPLYVQANPDYDHFVDDNILYWDDEEEPQVIARNLTIAAASRLSTSTASNRATVRLHPNWGNDRPVVTVSRTRGGPVGSLQRPRRRPLNSQRRRPLFIDWFTTSATTGGRRIRSNSIVPNTATWNLHARWTNPNRHENQWWRPADSGNTMIRMRLDNVPSRFRTPIRNAKNRWNSSNARIEFRSNSSSNNRVRVRNRSPRNRNTFGSIHLLETSNADNSRLVRFNIYLYSGRIDENVRDNRDATFSRVAESVMSHELGHVVGLRDNPTGASNRNDSIMNTNRRRWIRIRPSTSDINNVNRIY